MDWSIQQIARLAGTTSRTLRHYGDLGLLEPTRIGANGYRYYDQAALTRCEFEGLGGDEVGTGISGVGVAGRGLPGPEDVDWFGHVSRVVQPVTVP